METVDMTSNDSDDFLAKIPIGVYRLDADDRVVYANDAWLELHGYQTLDQVQGHHIRFAYARPKEAEQLRTAIIANGVVKDVTYEFKRPNGEHFWASIYSIEVLDPEGRYAGREGIILDVTERQVHRKIMDAIPVGYYAVETKGEIDKITYCNQVFADMFGFPSPQEAVGTNISQLYLHPIDYKQYRSRIERGQENEVQHQLEVKTIDGKKSFRIEARTKVQRRAKNIPIGRIGVVRDLSLDEPFKKLRQDLGNVLHTFTTGLIAIKSDIEAALEALGPNPLPKAPSISPEQLQAEMREPLANLRRSIFDLLEVLVNRNDFAGVHKIFNDFQLALDEGEAATLIFRPHILHKLANKIADTCQDILNNRKAPRQPLKRVREDAYEVMRVFANTRLQERISDVLQMDHALRSLRAYITAPSYEIQRKNLRFKLWTVVEQAMRNLHDFADSRGVAFKPAPSPAQASVFADEQEILRVITNLLHNSVKYSWSRETGTWVSVNLQRTGQKLVLEIENYGVPIPADEIDSGLIYKFGFRSRLATDRGRVGSGIGLADATETLRRHGGSIEINSRPAFPGAEAERLEPHLTTAIMAIAIAE